MNFVLYGTRGPRRSKRLYGETSALQAFGGRHWAKEEKYFFKKIFQKAITEIPRASG